MKVIKQEKIEGYDIVLVWDGNRVSSGVMEESGYFRELYGIIQIMGKWTVGCSTCLPSDLDKASAYIAALNMLWDYYKEGNHEIT